MIIAAYVNKKKHLDKNIFCTLNLQWYMFRISAIFFVLT